MLTQRMLNLFRNKRRDCRQAERGAGCAVRWGPGRGRRRPRGSRDCCPPTTLAKLEPVSHLRPPPRRAGGTSLSPAREQRSGWGAGRAVPGHRGGRPGGSGGLRCPALPSRLRFPPLPPPERRRQRRLRGCGATREGREEGDRFASPTGGTDPAGRSRPAQRCSAPAFARRHLAERRRGVRLSARRGSSASPAAALPGRPPQPLTCMRPLRPWRPAGDPGTSSYLELRAGRLGGRGRRRRGGGRAVAGRRGLPGLRCSRRPGTTDGGGKRRPSEGGRREGGKGGGGREGGMEGRKEGGRSASRPERCTAPFKGAETRFLHGRRSRLPATPRLAAPAATRPPRRLPAAAGLRGRPAKHKRFRRSSPRRPPRELPRARRAASFQGVGSRSSFIGVPEPVL